MNINVLAKRNVLTLMRRLRRDERIEDAPLRYPVDVVRDSAILTDLGREFDDIVNQLGGSAW